MNGRLCCSNRFLVILNNGVGESKQSHVWVSVPGFLSLQDGSPFQHKPSSLVIVCSRGFKRPGLMMNTVITYAHAHAHPHTSSSQSQLIHNRNPTFYECVCILHTTAIKKKQIMNDTNVNVKRNGGFTNPFSHGAVSVTSTCHRFLGCVW